MKLDRRADAWLIVRANGTREVVLSPLTDDTFLDEGDEAIALGQIDDIERQMVQEEYIAWCRYVRATDRPTRIVLCNSDDKGAFKVYRAAAPSAHSSSTQQWAVFCPNCGKKWVVDRPHNGSQVCEQCLTAQGSATGQANDAEPAETGARCTGPARPAEICPDCGRTKANSDEDCGNGLCPKWYATRDPDAEYDCSQARRANSARPAEPESETPLTDALCGPECETGGDVQHLSRIFERELRAAKERIAELERQLDDELAEHASTANALIAEVNAKFAAVADCDRLAAKLAEIEQDMARLLHADSCPNCPNQGWIGHQSSTEMWEQEQCEFCYTNENSLFNVRAAIDSARSKHA